MIKGAVQFDAIAVGEFTATFIGPTLEFKAKAAFVNSRTGNTHGWTTNQTWSPEVIAKLKELKGLMETDLATTHFKSGGELISAVQRNSPEPTGIGEYVAADQV